MRPDSIRTAWDVYRTTAFKSCVASTTALPARASCRAEVENTDGVLHIEICRGLVQQNEFRLNRQAARDHHALALTAGERIDRAPAQFRNTAPLHRLFDGLAIRRGRALESPAMRVPAHGDDLGYRERKIQPVVLRHEGNPLRDGTPSQRAERLSVQGDRALRDGPDSGQGAQQRTLPAAVGTRDGHNDAGFHPQIHAIENSASAASDGDSASFERVHDALTSR